MDLTEELQWDHLLGLYCLVPVEESKERAVIIEITIFLLLTMMKVKRCSTRTKIRKIKIVVMH